MTLIIGLMSGTSMDGIDAVLVNVTGRETDLSIQLIRSQTFVYDSKLREQIIRVAHGECLSLEVLAQLDDQIAEAFSQAAIAIQSEDQPATLIGSHGQTVFHRPPIDLDLGYTIQLGRGDLIAQRTGLPTVSDFRVADVAAGGQGAPLVPRIDLCLLSHPTLSRCVQNIGGMGNTTFLPALDQQSFLGEGVKGWDTGPGNILIDLAVHEFSQGELTFDRDGQWAAQGQPCRSLVEKWLTDPFFAESPPKSTGREYFGSDYLTTCIGDGQALQLSEADILATLTDFTAQAIFQEYQRYLPQLPDEVLICGGGSRNAYLRSRLSLAFDDTPVRSTDDMGVDSDGKEAIAFAILAYWNRLGIPGNLAAVTGARRDVVLGRCFGLN